MIEYCDNGRYSNNDRSRANAEPKLKMRRTNDAVNAVNVVKTYDEDDEEESDSRLKSNKNTTNPGSSTPDQGFKPEIIPKTEPMEKGNHHEKDDVESESPPHEQKKHLDEVESKRKQTESTDMFSFDAITSNHGSTNNKQTSNDLEANECAVNKSPEATESPLAESSDNMDVTSTTQDNHKSLSNPSVARHEGVLSEDKMKQYIDEYDSFIQQVASPLNEPLKGHHDIAKNVLLLNSLPQPDQCDKDARKNEVTSTSTTQKSQHKTAVQSSSSSSSDDDSSSSTDSSSSSSSSDDDSSSSDSSSSSSSDNESSNDEKHRRRKSYSKSSSSRSASKSPRIRSKLGSGKWNLRPIFMHFVSLLNKLVILCLCLCLHFFQ